MMVLMPQAQTFMHVYSNNGQQSAYKVENIDTIYFDGNFTDASHEAVELLNNGGFEVWADDLPTCWKSTTTASNATLAQSTDAHSGSYAVSVGFNKSGNKRMAYQELMLDAGTYSFSFYAKATADGQAKVKAGYVAVGADGKPGTYKYMANYAELNATEWTLVSHQFTLSEATTVNLIVMNPSASAQNILIDDASLTTAASADDTPRYTIRTFGNYVTFNLAETDSITFVWHDPTTEANPLHRLEFPAPKADGHSLTLVHEATLNDHTGQQGVNYSVEWDPELNTQRWSCYQLYASVLEKIVDRYSGRGTDLSPRSQYPNDPDLDAAYQFTIDPYPGSGFDHGHICPSDDRVSSAEANYQTFFMTNMMPQTHSLNAGIWKRMEAQVKSWGAQYDTLYVCKGGTIDDPANILGYIGQDENAIPIPKYFFMALLGKSATGYTAIGFWVDHSGNYTTANALSEFTLNIKELENRTGLDFFQNLPDDIETIVESADIEGLNAKWGLSN